MRAVYRATLARRPPALRAQYIPFCAAVRGVGEDGGATPGRRQRAGARQHGVGVVLFSGPSSMGESNEVKQILRFGVDASTITKFQRCALDLRLEKMENELTREMRLPIAWRAYKMLCDKEG